jgi:hypothetical protein
MAEYNSFLAITQANDLESSKLIVTISNSLLEESKSARLPPFALVEVVTRAVRDKSGEYADLKDDQTNRATLEENIKQLERKIREATDTDTQTKDYNRQSPFDQDQRPGSSPDRGLPDEPSNKFQAPKLPVSPRPHGGPPAKDFGQYKIGGPGVGAEGAVAQRAGNFAAGAQPTQPVMNGPKEAENAGQPKPADESEGPGPGSLSDQSKLETLQAASLAENQEHLRQMKQRLANLIMLDGLEEPVRTFVKEKTSLAPFAGQLVTPGIAGLLDNKDIKWSAFGDREVFALVAFAAIWSQRTDPDARIGSRLLCTHILREYYPDDFALNWTLFWVAEGDEKGIERASNHTLRNCISVMDRNIKWSLQYDPKSRLYMRWKLAHHDARVSIYCEGWPRQVSDDARYQRAIRLYRGPKGQYADFPEFHNSLAIAYEYRAKQLEKTARAHPGSDKRAGVASAGVREISKCSLQERREACRLDPNNQEYRDSFLTSLGRQLITGNVFTDPPVEREVPKRIEIEVSQKSIADLGFTDKGLSEESKQKINEVRLGLQTDFGFALPFINFRDNSAFEQGEFRFLIRGVPLPLENLPAGAAPAVQWDMLAQRIKETALSYASCSYTSQDCYMQVKRMAKESKTDCTDIQSDCDAISVLTQVLKMLLREQVPIADFAAIVSEFRRCRSSKLDLVHTVEEIRFLPQIRKRLPGNSFDFAAVIRLEPEVEDRLDRAIDWKCSEPILNSSQELRQQVRSTVLRARSQAGRARAVVLTSSAVRPFVFMTIEDMDVNVLSDREIFPALLSRIKDADAADPKQLPAQAGS